MQGGRAAGRTGRALADVRPVAAREARNIADPETVLQIARDAGFEAAGFARLFEDPETAIAVETDRQVARALQVRSVPALIIRDTGTRLVNGPSEDLAAQIRAAQQILA